MSGFLPDIASWALGGGAAGANNNNDGGGENNEQQNTTTGNEGGGGPSPPTADEMRAKRMARLAALEKQSSTSASTSSGTGGEGAVSGSMDVDKPPPSSDAQPMDVDDEVAKPTAATATPPTKKSSTTKDVTMKPAPSSETIIPAKKKIKTPPTPTELQSKHRRKKILLLRKVLLVTFGDTNAATTDRSTSCVHLQLDDDGIYNSTKSPNGVAVRHIAELLAARLSIPPSCRTLETLPSQSKLGLVGYLGGCHKRAGGELKELRQGGKQQSNTNKGNGNISDLEELCEILEEIRNQVRIFFYHIVSCLWHFV